MSTHTPPTHPAPERTRPTASARGRRDRTIDVAKGLAITAIVLSHALRDLAGPDTIPRESLTFLEIDDALYSWHVAVFAFAAGVFVPSGVDRRGAWPYLRPRLLLFTWLYLLWTALQVGQRQLGGALRDEPVEGETFLVGLLTAYGQLWWLPFMVLASVIAVLTTPWRSPSRAVWSGLALTAVALVTWGWTGEWAFLEGLALLVFFWVGLVAGRPTIALLTRPSNAVPVALLGVALGVVLLVVSDPIPPTSWMEERTVAGIALGVVTSASLCSAVVAMSGPFSHSAIGRFFAMLGERSLGVFLGHIIAFALVNEALYHLGGAPLAVRLPALVVGGIALPLGVWWLGRRLRLPWLFETPVR